MPLAVVSMSTVTAAGGERAALVEAVMPFLDEWQNLLKDIRQLTPERVGGMLDRAARLRHQADLAGQGGVVHHIEVCVELLKAPGLDRRSFQEALRNLSEVTWQLKQEVGNPRRGSALPHEAVPHDVSPHDVAPLEGGPRSMARPPLLSDLASASPGPRALGPRGGVEPPPPISLPGGALPSGAFPGAPAEPVRREPRGPEACASGARRPRLRERAAGVPAGQGSAGAGSRLRAAAHLDRSMRSDGGARAPAIERPPQPPAAPVVPPARPFQPQGPSIIPGAGARSPAPAPFAASPPILSPRPPAGQPPFQKGKDKPNLMVATMFGLRAFGRGKGASPGAQPAPGQPPAAPGQKGGGVLGLGQRARREPSDAPAWIGPREGGLPELATSGTRRRARRWRRSRPG